jgi:methionyl-tRNA synthetase
MRDRLLEFYEQNPEWVIPSSRMAEVVAEVTSGLSDLSISRPSSRVSWGIPVPDDGSQSIYVWLDALLNYAVSVGYPNGPFIQNGWPVDVQVIGKDILRFHAIYWPAFLLALSLPLPKRILSHAHWTLGNTKMSKSRGNVVNPFHAVDAYSVDVIRWYLAHDGGVADDSDYNNLRIVERYKTLRGGLGNFVSRVTRARKWNVPLAVQETWALDSPSRQLVMTDEHLKPMYDHLCALQGNVAACLDQHDVRGALMLIMDTISLVRSFISFF